MVRDLVARIGAGDKAAETLFVREYQAVVRVLVRRHTRPNEPMLDDFVQDVLHHVLEKLRARELRDPAALPGYLRQAIVHSTTAEYRRRATRGEPVAAEVLEQLPAEQGDPADRLRTQQLAAHVRTVLAEMPVARDRALLARFYLEERDKDEICSDLGIDPGHFRRVIFRARERLRELLENNIGDIR
jgi:RNA polymerase sigma-70 factor (ECF subfamily)